MLHLVTCASQSVNCLSHNESEDARNSLFSIDFASKLQNSAFDWAFKETQCDSNNWPIVIQKVPKDALSNTPQILLIFFSKLFCLTQTVARQITYVWSKVDVFFGYSVYCVIMHFCPLQFLDSKTTCLEALWDIFYNALWQANFVPSIAHRALADKGSRW